MSIGKIIDKSKPDYKQQITVTVEYKEELYFKRISFIEDNRYLVNGFISLDQSWKKL